MDALVAMTRRRPRARCAASRRRASSRAAARRSTCASSRAHQLGAALLYFTGSKGHNIKLRQRALARGLTLNEYALSELEGGTVVASETEEQIYAALGLPWIPPVLREDAGEIEAAERGALPRPIGDADRRLPRAHDGVGRRALAARGGGRGGARARLPRARDHRSRRGHALRRRPRGAPRAARARSARCRPSSATRSRSSTASSSTSARTASSTTTPSSARGFDWCLASVHDHFELDRAAQTRRVVTAMQDPTVRMIGHLSARMIGGRPPIELDLDAILAAAEATGTALEINGAPAAPRPVRRSAAPRARARRHLRADERRAPRARARARALRRAQRRARLGRARARRERLAGRAARGLGDAAEAPLRASQAERLRLLRRARRTRAGAGRARSAPASSAIAITASSVACPRCGDSRSTMPKAATAAAKRQSADADANAAPGSLTANSSGMLSRPSGLL